MTERASEDRSALAGLFVISLAILALEILQIRILSVQMWYHHAYVVVTLTLLGFAAAGTAVTLWPDLARSPTSGKLAACSTLFGIAVVVSQLVLAGATSRLKPLTTEGVFGPLLYSYSVMVLPFFFGGLVITIALSSTERVHKRYFVNLLGSAIGAWVFIAAITPVGGERLLILCAALGPVAALCFLARSPRSPVFLASLAALLAAVPLWMHAPDWFEVEIGPGKLRTPYARHLERRWTPLSCLDLFTGEAENFTEIHILQDGGAGTFMYADRSWRSISLLDPKAMAYVPSVRRARKGAAPPRVAAIGIGGGVDLRIAKELGAARVLGIEINEQMVRITRDDYADFNGGVARQPGVELVMGEGRSTLRRLDETFDVIEISGADTYTSATSGSFVLSESYLYTSEAIGDYLDHLDSHGVLGIMRFSDDPPWEMLRLFGTGLMELRRRGVKEPSKHAVAIKRTYSGTDLFSPEPFEPEDIAYYLKADSGAAKDLTLYYVPGLEATRTNDFTELARAVDEGREEEFFRSYPVDIRPVSDDAPFFYNFHHLAGSWEVEPSSFSKEFDIHFPVAPKVLSTLLLQTLLLVLALVLLPLAVLRRSGLRAMHSGRHLMFFAGVGMAFMFLEISAIQRLALFLGHPVHSVTVVLFSFLLFAGLGSLLSGRLAARPTAGLRLTVALLAAVILLFNVVLDPILDRFLYLPFPARVAIAVGLMAPMNILMGMPFPLALSRLRRLQPELVPWALGVNGGASVIGSVVCVVLAMELGFTVVTLLAAALYLLAMLVATTSSLRGEPAG